MIDLAGKRFKKLKLLRLFWGLVFLLLLCRLLQVQGADYAVQAFWQEGEILALEAYPRGEILDRQGNSLTGSSWEYRAAVWSEYLSENAVQQLKQVLQVNKLDLPSDFGLLPYKLSQQQAENLIQMQLPGIWAVPYWVRYGKRPLAASVVGYLGRVRDWSEAEELQKQSGKTYTPESWVGRQGLEKYYEAELQGGQAQGAIRLFTDALGQKIVGNQPEIYTHLEDKQRSNVVTTLDGDLQKLAEDTLGQRCGAIVIMNRFGELLALASSPDFNPDPAKLAGYLEQPESLLDQTTALFQPGSIFKIVVAAAALEEKLVTLDQVFCCEGTEDERIPCWKKEGHGRITFAEAFAQSCNPVFVHLAQELGADKLIEYAQKLGLDNQQITGYPVPRNKEQDFSRIALKYNLNNSAIGQGPVLLTPIQISALLNTLVNGGVYQQPCLVQAIQKEGETQKLRREEGRRAIEVQTALTLQKLLSEVVINGVGQKAALNSVGCGGKTGSAEVGDGTVNAWFSGFLPAQDPQYIITILVRAGESGSSTAAPLFKKIGEALYAFE